MKVLLDDRYAPITSTAGFFEAPLNVVGDALFQWLKSLKRSVTMERLKDPFPEVLHRLEPLTAEDVPRELLLSTGSSWTAYFNNALLGTDAFGPVSHLCFKLKCRGLIVSCVPHTIQFRTGEQAVGRFGIVKFQLYGGEETDWLNLVRSVSVAADIGGWEFETSGEPQPFEQLERYTARRKRDRFTPEMLDEYCRAVGVRYFDADFYGPDSVFIEALGRHSHRAIPRTLADVQRQFNILPPYAPDEGQ